MPDDVLDRIYARCRRDARTGCLRWQGAKNRNGYGRIHVAGKLELVHRVVCERVHGPIPAGWVVDHVHARGCRHVDCANPDHLEAVTWSENMRRSRHPKAVTARTGVCAAGHRIEGDNAQRERNGVRCRRCALERKRKDRAA